VSIRPNPSATEEGESHHDVRLGWLRQALKLSGVFLLCLAAALIQFFWARAGRVKLPEIPARVALDQLTAEIPDTSLTFAPGQRALQLGLKAQFRTINRGDPYFYYDVWVHDSAGREVAHWQDRLVPYHRPIDDPIGEVRIEHPGTYRLRIKLTSYDAAQLESVIVRPAVVTRSSYFSVLMITAGTVLAGAFLFHVRRHPLPGLPPTLAAEPVIAPQSVDAPLAVPLVLPSPRKRFLQRLGLEAAVLVVSFTWLPVFGLYGFLLLLAGTMYQTPEWLALMTTIQTKFMALPFAAPITAWLGMEKSYQGFDGLVSFGGVVSRVIFLVYLVTLPVRWLVPSRWHPGFRIKAGLLLLFTLGLIGALAYVMQFVKRAPGSGYWGLVGVMSFFCFACFGFSLIILGVGHVIDRALRRLVDPDTQQN
jgi:hypothetical protein